MVMVTAMATAMAMASRKARHWRRVSAGSERGRTPLRLLHLSAVLFAAPASAATWVIVPTLSVSETVTDNVNLAPAGSERRDWVTSVSPGISVSASGPRLRLSAAYSPQLVYRANQGTDDVFQQLNANANTELMQQLLFVDATA